MPLSAKFTADFSSFYDAVQKAEAHLKGFEITSSRVSGTLDRMGDAFSGRKLLQDATLMTRAIESAGLATKLTDAEMRKWTGTIAAADEKMKALGMRTTNIDDFNKAIGRGNTQTADSFKALFTNVDKTTAVTNTAADAFRATFTDAPKQVAGLGNAIKPMPDSFDTLKSAVLGAGGALGIAFSGTAILSGIKAQIDAAYEYGSAITNMSARTSIGVVALQKLEAIGVTSGVSMQDLAGAVNVLQQRIDDPKALQALRSMGLNYENLRNLRPEDQFLTIARAVSQIENPIDRANAGAAIFKGTWTTIAPAITKDMQTIIDQAKTLSAEQIAALDKNGAGWSTFFHNFHVGVMGMIADYELGQQAYEKQTWSNPFKRGPVETPTLPAAPQARVGNVTGFVGAHVTGFVDPKIISEIKVGGQTLDEQSKSIDKNAAAQKAWADIADRTKTATVALTTQQAKQIDAWTKAGVSASTAATALGINERAVSNYMDAQRDLAKVIPVTNAAVAKFEDLVSSSALRSGLTQINRDTEALTGTLAQFTGKFKGAEMFPEPPSTTFDAWKKTQGAITETMPMMMRLGENMKSFVSKDFGKIVVSSLAGGGSAVKATLAGFGNELFAKEGAFGKSIGSGIEGIFGKSGMAGKIGGMIGGMVPIIGSFIGPAIEGMTKLFGKVFGKSEETKSVSPLRDEFFKMQGGLEALNPRVMELTGNLSAVQAVFDAKTVEQYNAAIGELNNLFKQEQDALALLDETATRYGFTIEELGPAMQRQKLDKQAQQLFKDWEVLNAAGIDTVAITSRMASGVNDYVGQALKMGTEVPEAMRPMLTQMAQMGQLTDANGNKINNLEDSGLTFSMTMSEGFNKLIGEVQKLADVLTRSLGGAVDQTQKQIAKFPTKIPIEVAYKTTGDVPKGASASVPGYQGGTHGKFVDFGAGSLVMLHGKEAVVPQDETGGAELGASSATGGGPGGSGVTVHIDARGALFNDPGSDQRLAALVERALSAKHGLTHRRRAA